jgi:cell division septum initiation protein DivIVA
MEFESIDVEAYKFDVVRKGYDRLQVEDFLQKISKAMARLEERRKLAEVKSEQAARELEDLRARAEITIQETVAARARMIAASAERPKDDPVVAPKPWLTADQATMKPWLTADQATMEAQQIIEQATSQATSIHAEAEAVLASALSTSAKIHGERDEVLDSVGAERAALIAAASEEADAIRTAALEEAELARAEAHARADEIRRLARADANALVEDARKRSAEIAAGATIPETAAPATAARYADDTDSISVDLREGAAEHELESANRTERASRYKSRSAHLPSLGDDAGSVIGSLDSLRSKEARDG